MWNVTINVNPVTSGATGTAANSLRQYLSNIPGEQVINDSLNSAPFNVAGVFRIK